MNRPRIAVTMGDAAGVGPEIIVAALSQSWVQKACRPIVIGDLGRLKKVAASDGNPVAFHSVSQPEDGLYTEGTIDVIDLQLIPDDLPFGEISGVAGHAAYEFIARAVEYAVEKRVDAICTGPLNKKALHAGGHIYPGHTELLAELTGTPEVSMMLTAPNLRVIHVTTHVGLVDAIGMLNPGLVERTITRAHDALLAAGVAAPRIGVCAVNPHGGEGGLFGNREEELVIAPGIELARANGIDALGPIPADTAFFRAVRGDFDIVVAMYHDQGHCPIKVLGIDTGVNITVGLPVIRTSVDHGTAFDIAGKGIADANGMTEALRQAISMAPSADG